MRQTPDAGEVDAAGWMRGVMQIPSPNCDARPPERRIDLVVLHGISLPPGRFGTPDVPRLFLNALDPDAHPYFAGIGGLRVSAHLLIRRDGRRVQFVPFSQRAWHAGVSVWRGRERCNDFSVGIELEGEDDSPYTDAQYAALDTVLACLYRHYPVQDVTGHSDIAPGRKTDPGPCFDWTRVRRPPF